MLKINKDVESQLLKDCQVGSFEDLQNLNTGGSVVVSPTYDYYIYYNPEMDGPFLVSHLEGTLLVSKERHIKYEKEIVCHCSNRDTEKDKFLYNSSDTVHLWENYKCDQCGKKYKIMSRG